MEILKFDEGDTKPKSRKFSSRGSILVAAVAIMFGASTALAGSTLTINGNNKINLNQGVATTVQCDVNGVDLSLGTEFVPGSPAGVFKLNKIEISDIDNADPDIVTGLGCKGKVLTIKLFGSSGESGPFCKTTATADTGCIDSGNALQAIVTGTSLTFNLSNILTVGDDTIQNVTIVSSD